MAANSAVIGGILTKCELIQGCKSWKFKNDRINSNRENGYIEFRRSRSADSLVNGGDWSKFKLIQAFMYVLVIRKYEKDPFKNSQKHVNTVCFHYKYTVNWERNWRHAKK